jgi:hypothetical protein
MAVTVRVVCISVRIMCVFRHHENNEYLFYSDGMWLIGPDPARRVGGLFVNDGAWRPEYTLHSWVVFNGPRGFEREPSIRVVCEGKPLISK